MASEFRLIQTVALFAAVALFSPAWAEPEEENYYLKKYGKATPEQITDPVGEKNKMAQEKNIFDDYSDISIKINESIKVKIFYIIY